MSHRVSRPRRSWGRRLALLGSVGLVLVTTTGCTVPSIVNTVFFIDQPEPVTEEGEILSSLWQGSWSALWPVGFLVWGLLLFCILAYSKKRRPDIPKQTTYNLPIETMYTFIPLVMVLGLFWFTAQDEAEVLEIKGDESHVVNVIGFRWSWGFNYLDEDVHEVGEPLNFTKPDGSLVENQDAAPTLWLPVDEKVRIELTSPDVIHSFWVVDWLFKLDVIPGKNNQFAVTPSETGLFEGKCAELCGTDHSRMLFNVKVVERDEYEAHIGELRQAGQVGQLDTGRVNTDGEPNIDGRTL